MDKTAEKFLMAEYKALSKESWTNISLINDNILEWSVALIVLNPDSLYYGGYFKAKMTFPKNYPYSPPDFKFLKPLYHPNVYPDGRLCISILHPPGDDEQSGETAAERWNPVQKVESVLISILSLLDDAEVSSPANVDAGVLLRTSPDAYKAKVRRDLEASKADIPRGFVMPTHEDAFGKRTADEAEQGFVGWSDSEEEDEFGEEDFGGSESELGDGDEDEEGEEGDSESEVDAEDDEGRIKTSIR
ncbi:hypothetical protein B0A49_00026 [Cryomyces minteri]|uniref:Ubiquitin-conjugating enzyme E2 2 n=2 Tax=Cryomyces TaxID=329878 RepID=A0A4U0XZK0_9PEZI|nr:hypothetical protein B0A49_00026 [Cryomyces minteri]